MLILSKAASRLLCVSTCGPRLRGPFLESSGTPNSGMAAGRQEPVVLSRRPLGGCRWLWALNYPPCPTSRVGSHLPKVVTGVVLENAFGGLEGCRGHRSWGPDFLPSLHP